MITKIALALVLLVAIDGTWLGLVAKNFYRSELGTLMTSNVNWFSAVAFYLLYACGLVYFAVLPATGGGWMRAFQLGAAFGLVAYGTYDLTCLTIIKGYSAKLAVVDMAWGAFLSGAVTALVVGLHRP